MNFLERRIHLITGKGGVGRTTVAVSLAKAIAQHGKRVLIAEIGDPEGGYSAVGRHLGQETLDDTPRAVGENLFACHLWGETGHVEFLKSVIPVGPLAKTALRSRALRRFLKAAPAFQELGVFYHFLTLLRETENGQPRFETVVLDMPATGHTLALTGLPEIILRLVPKGPMAGAMREGQRLLNNPETTAAWVVSLPEKLPITESIELLDGLRATQITPGGVLLNRYPPDPFTDTEREALKTLVQSTNVHGEIAFWQLLTAHEESARLRSTVDLPVLNLPWVLPSQPQSPETVLTDVLFEAATS